MSNPAVFGAYVKREFLSDETTGNLAPWLTTVEGRRRRYSPFSPRAWKETKLEPYGSTGKEGAILESDLDSS